MGHLEYSWLFAERHKQLFRYKNRRMAEERQEREIRAAAEAERFRSEMRMRAVQSALSQQVDTLLPAITAVADESLSDGEEEQGSSRSFFPRYYLRFSISCSVTFHQSWSHPVSLL